MNLGCNKPKVLTCSYFSCYEQETVASHVILSEELVLFLFENTSETKLMLFALEEPSQDQQPLVEPDTFLRNKNFKAISNKLF